MSGTGTRDGCRFGGHILTQAILQLPGGTYVRVALREPSNCPAHTLLTAGRPPPLQGSPSSCRLFPESRRPSRLGVQPQSSQDPSGLKAFLRVSSADADFWMLGSRNARFLHPPRSGLFFGRVSL